MSLKSPSDSCVTSVPPLNCCTKRRDCEPVKSPSRYVSKRALIVPSHTPTLGGLAVAFALVNWHGSAGFSSRDGEATSPAQGGWARVDAHGGEHFPRTDPAVIVLSVVIVIVSFIFFKRKKLL